MSYTYLASQWVYNDKVTHHGVAAIIDYAEGPGVPEILAEVAEYLQDRFDLAKARRLSVGPFLARLLDVDHSEVDWVDIAGHYEDRAVARAAVIEAEELADQLDDLAAVGDLVGLRALLAEQEPKTWRYHAVLLRMHAVEARLNGQAESAKGYEGASEWWLTEPAARNLS